MEAAELETRERLLNAAIAVVDESGVEAIRVREIATAAQVREPSVYHYFGSREGLVEAVEAARFKRDSKQVTNIFAQGVTACQSMNDYLALVKAVMTAVEQPDRAVVRSVRASAFGSAQSRPGLAKLISEAQLELDQDLANGLLVAQERGWVRPDLDCLTYGAWVNGMVNGRIILEMNPEVYSADTWREILLTAALAGMGYSQGKPTWT